MNSYANIPTGILIYIKIYRYFGLYLFVLIYLENGEEIIHFLYYEGNNFLALIIFKIDIYSSITYVNDKHFLNFILQPFDDK